jgi:branched-chain amino acid transport system substrate-binding protein
MKKVLSFVLAALLVAGLAACGGGASGGAIKIGGTGPLTGGAAI